MSMMTQSSICGHALSVDLLLALAFPLLVVQYLLWDWISALVFRIFGCKHTVPPFRRAGLFSALGFCTNVSTTPRQIRPRFLPSHAAFSLGPRGFGPRELERQSTLINRSTKRFRNGTLHCQAWMASIIIVESAPDLGTALMYYTITIIYPHHPRPRILLAVASVSRPPEATTFMHPLLGCNMKVDKKTVEHAHHVLFLIFPPTLLRCLFCSVRGHSKLTCARPDLRNHAPEVLYSASRYNGAKREGLGDTLDSWQDASFQQHRSFCMAQIMSFTSRSCHVSSAWQHSRAFHSATTWPFPHKPSHVPQDPSPVLFSISTGQFWLPTSTSVWFSPRADHVPILVTHVMRVNMH